MSDISSAGIARGSPGYGKTCRKDVLCRVDVPVVPGAAGRAGPVPGTQGSPRAGACTPSRFWKLGTSGRSRPVRAVALALYSNWRRISPHPPSQIARASAGCGPCRPRSGPRSLSCRLADQAGAGAVQEVRRASRTLRWARATLAAALARFADLSGSGPGAAGSGPGSWPCAAGDADWRSAWRRC